MQAVDWGAQVVQRLIPQRRPYLMLDRIAAWQAEPEPTIVGCRYISANDPVFDGHFPDMPIWPGVRTIEGLAQAASALMALVTLSRELGRDALMHALEHVEFQATLHPGLDPEAVAVLDAAQTEGRAALPSLFGAADVKLLAPVFPGCRLEYRVRCVRRMREWIRFDAEAWVGSRRVAAGGLSSKR